MRFVHELLFLALMATILGSVWSAAVARGYEQTARRGYYPAKDPAFVENMVKRFRQDERESQASIEADLAAH